MFYSIVTTAADPEGWTIFYSDLGAVSAVESALRFSTKVMLDEFNEGDAGDPAPLVTGLAVGVTTVGPIGEDGTPHDGTGPLFFSWNSTSPVKLEEYVDELRKKVNA